MLAKLALGNIRRNFRTYWAYFFSAAFGVFVLYLFLSVVYGKATKSAASFQTTQVLFGIGAILTALFTAFFIWYSNSFFIKSRKKEFATYMLLGMSKKQTMGLSFLENLAILSLAYAVGIAAGILLNKLLIMVLFYIMREKAAVPFEINLAALRTCSFIYLGVFILIVIHSAILLNKTSLIALIHASKKAERGMKVSWLTWVVGALAVLFMGWGYYLAIVRGSNIITWPVIVLFVCIGTALLFLGLATLFFHFMRKNEMRLYRGTKLVTVSQLMHRFRGNVGALTVIAITTSVALCAVMSCCGLYVKSVDNSHKMRPFSVEYVDTGNDAGAILNAALAAHPEVTEKSRVAFTLLKAYEAGTQTNDRHPYYTVIGESNYNEIMRAQRRREIRLDGEDRCHFIKYNNLGNTTKSMQNEAAILLGGNALTFRIQSRDSDLFCALDHVVSRMLVVKDAVYERILGAGGAEPVNYVGMELSNDMQALAFTQDLDKRLPKDNKLLTFYRFYNENLSMFSVLMFVGVFIGLLFVVATGGILYFRMAMEASEDRERYVTLARIGMSAREMRAAIAKGLGIVFGVPFIVAALNTLVALSPLQIAVSLNMLDAYAVIVAVYASFYALYYLLTLNKYVKTVGEGAVR